MTILGQHTVTELRDLVKAKDEDLRQFQLGYEDFAPTWKAKDPVAFEAWTKAWKALKTRYSNAKTMANITFSAQKVNPLSEDETPAEGAYSAILRSLQKVEGTVSPGDKQDLFNRIVAAGKALDYKVPQPDGKDVDLQVYLLADKAKKQVDAVGGIASSPWTWAGIGALALGGLYAANKVRKL